MGIITLDTISLTATERKTGGKNTEMVTEIRKVPIISKMLTVDGER